MTPHEARKALNEGGKIFYHGTSSVAMQQILKEGLIPKKGKGLDSISFLAAQWFRSYVFLAGQKEDAFPYAQCATWADKGSPVVLEVKLPTSYLHRLRKDAFGYRFDGPIPPEWIAARPVRVRSYPHPITEALKSNNNDLQRLIEIVVPQFALDWRGIHGAPHWIRVRQSGLKLAEVTGAKAQVVELFAFLHDARRVSDNHDPEHGERGAHFAVELREQGVIELSDSDFDLLTFACAEHSKGYTDADVTIQTCWDADRLDLGRVGMSPHPDYLCTDAAKDERMIEWAFERSLQTL